MSHVSHTRSASWLAAVAALGLAVTVPGTAHAATQILNYNFPASWNGTGTAVTDLSPAGNNGIVSTTAAKDPTLSAVVPADAAAGTQSAVTTTGGFQTTATSLLTNPIIAGAGGFTYSVEFMWNGTDSSSFGHAEKLIDYAGTESLQVDTTGTAAAPGTAALNFIFTTQGVSPAPDVTAGPSVPILANTWYKATATFDTLGNAVDVNGNLAGLASLTVAPVGGLATTASLAVTKTPYGDGAVLGPRPIGIGELAYPSTSLALVPFLGNVYNPSVSLGVVPEPASLSLLGLGATALLARRRRA